MRSNRHRMAVSGRPRPGTVPFFRPARAFLLLCGALLIPSPAPSAETIRVDIADRQKSVVLQSSSGLDFGQDQTGHLAVKKTFTPGSLGTRPARVKSPRDFIRVNGAEYRGTIELRKDPAGGILVINELDVEEYLMGVVAAEIPPGWEHEALKAQAVASRTYALQKKKSARGKPYHLTATIRSQIYRGKSGERATTVRAVRDTDGMVLTHRGAVVPAFYHSSCGGHTEDAFELWGLDAAFLKGVDCDCQEISPYGVWQKKYSYTLVAKSLRQSGYALDPISQISIGRITPAGRVMEIAVRHAGGTAVIPGEALRAALGYDLIPSVFFEVTNRPGEVVFSGRGRGHGVGLCQWGAREMARRGHDYVTILNHYYPGTTLARID